MKNEPNLLVIDSFVIDPLVILPITRPEKKDIETTRVMIKDIVKK